MFDFLDAPPPPPSNQSAALLHGLNPPQALAVQTTEGPLLVLAGAGTGKTNVLTRRIAYLLLTHAAEPNEILAVTFTNKAAREMAERTEKLVGTTTAGMWLGTFHRLGVRFLRQHAEAAGLQRDFTILDADDQQRLLTQLLKDENLDTQQFPPRLVANLISKYKDNGWLPNQLPRDEAQALGNRAAQLYASYQQRLNALNAVDFGDLLLLPLHVLRTQPNILAYYQARLKYILVDEYQDTNGVQYEWLKMLAAQHKNLCVVGDDDQSIYGWRGAQVGNILNFETDFPGAQVVRLEQNYRSTGHILAAANAVIANNRQRHGKNLWTDAGNGNPVEVHPIVDEREEARFIADDIQRHIRTGGTLNDVAVLVRTASQTRVFEEQFVRSGLPYTLIGNLKFYERKEIKDALAYLRCIASPYDDLAFQRIVNVPRRQIGEKTMEAIESHAREENIPLMAAANSLIQSGGITGQTAGKLNLLLEQIGNWRNLSKHDPLESLVTRVLEESGYMDKLRSSKDDDKEEDAKSRIDNLNQLQAALHGWYDIHSFLEHVALVTDADTQESDTLKLMTIHAAKGLEFPLVFLPGFEEGLFPHQRAMNEEGQKGLEEERRLAYVAITRARVRCVISFAAARRMWGQFLPGTPSRFLMEIPEVHLKRATPTFGTTFPNTAYRPVHGFLPTRPQVGSTSDKRGNWQGTDTPTKAEPLIPYTTLPQHPSTPASQHPAYSVGQKVHHSKFGPGEIKAIEGAGEATKLTIAFKHAGTKKLLASLAKLD